MGSKLIDHGVSCFLFLVAIFAMKTTALEHNVQKFGAKGDGKTDDTYAFEKAWTQACHSKGANTLVIPKGKYIVGPLDLWGPCEESVISLQLYGTIQSAQKKSKTKGELFPNAWISFAYLEDFTIVGKGTFDGQGFEHDCNKAADPKTKCVTPPMNLLFMRVTKAHIQDITSTDSNGVHIGVVKSNDVTVKDVTFIEPKTSGSDAILIRQSTNVNVTNVNIKTHSGSCVTIGEGNSKINVEKMTCEEANGVRFGVIGKTPNEQPTSGVTVKNSTFSRTEGAIWIEGEGGSTVDVTLSDLVFEDLVMDSLENRPIYINQQACTSENCKTANPKSNVKISNAKFKNIKGTTKNPSAVYLQCSVTPGACKDLEFSDISLWNNGDTRFPSLFECKNVKPKVSGKVIPEACKVPDASGKYVDAN